MREGLVLARDATPAGRGPPRGPRAAENGRFTLLTAALRLSPPVLTPDHAETNAVLSTALPRDADDGVAALNVAAELHTRPKRADWVRSIMFLSAVVSGKRREAYGPKVGQGWSGRGSCLSWYCRVEP